MRTIVAFLIIFTALSTLPASIAPASAGYDSLAEAQKAATGSGQLLLVDFFTTWCAPCKVFDKDMETNEQLKASLAPFVVHKIDGEKGEGVELAEVHGVWAYPTYIVLNADGDVLTRFTGYEPEPFRAHLAGVLADPVTMTAREARFNANPNFGDAKALGALSKETGDYPKAVDYYRQAQKLHAESASELEMPILDAMAFTMDGDTPVYTVEEFAAQTERVFQTHPPTEKLLEAAFTMMYAAQHYDRVEAADPFVKKAVESSEEGAGFYRDQMLPHYYLRVTHEPERALEVKISMLPEKWEESPNSLNEMAWFCFKQDIQLEQAEAWARKAVELSSSGKARADHLDTLAEILNAQGKPGEALTVMREAEREDPKSEHVRSQITRFQSLATEP